MALWYSGLMAPPKHRKNKHGKWIRIPASVKAQVYRLHQAGKLENSQIATKCGVCTTSITNIVLEKQGVKAKV